MSSDRNASFTADETGYLPSFSCEESEKGETTIFKLMWKNYSFLRGAFIFIALIDLKNPLPPMLFSWKVSIAN